MYLPAEFVGHRSCKSGNVKPYIISYMNILDKIELTASSCNYEKFSKSGIPNFIILKSQKNLNDEKKRKAIAKHCAGKEMQ